MKITTSKIFTINRLDILKALIMAILTPALVIIQSSLDAGKLNFNWKAIGMAAVAGGGSYILKNFFSQTKVIVKGVPPDMVDIIQSNEPINTQIEPTPEH